MIRIIKEKITKEELKEIAKESFDFLVKGTVDINKGILALGGEFHSESFEKLIEEGSFPSDLWGINIHTDGTTIEFNSMMNIRPAQNNISLEIKDEDIKNKISKIVADLII